MRRRHCELDMVGSVGERERLRVQRLSEWRVGIEGPLGQRVNCKDEDVVM
jgi:hypothetical protein